MIKITLKHNRKGILKKDGTALIQWCLRYDGVAKYLSTGINVKPVEFDEESQRVTKKHARHGILNRKLREQLTALEDLEDQLIRSEARIRLNLFDGALRGGTSSRVNFIDFALHELEVENIKDSSKKEQRVLINKLRDFDRTLTFQDIDIEFCQRFEKYLKGKGLNPNSIHKEFKNLKKFVNRAIDKGFMEVSSYPFRTFKIKTVPTKKTFLTEQELMRLEDLDLSYHPDLVQSRDLFLFSCCSGLRFSDVVRLEEKHLVQRQGGLWIEMAMQKTSDLVSIPIESLLEGKGLEIINRYRDKNISLILPQLTNQYVNRSLKVLAKMADIPKVVSFHSSRHTFGTRLLNLGLPKESVQVLMGHKSISQTETYVKLLSDTIEKQVKSLRAA